MLRKFSTLSFLLVLAIPNLALTNNESMVRETIPLIAMHIALISQGKSNAEQNLKDIMDQFKTARNILKEEGYSSQFAQQVYIVFEQLKKQLNKLLSSNNISEQRKQTIINTINLVESVILDLNKDFNLVNPNDID